MEVAKVTSRGQITIPADIRKVLGVNKGDKVVFFQEDDGRVVCMNAGKIAFTRMQKAFEGEAERLNLKTEDDVVVLVDGVREQIWKERYENND